MLGITKASLSDDPSADIYAYWRANPDFRNNFV